MVRQRFSNRNPRGRRATATPQPKGTAWEQTLQQQLQQQWLAQSLLLRCMVREGKLFVLAEHLLHVEPNPEETFASLEAAIRVLLPEMLPEGDALPHGSNQLPTELLVQLLLRISGYQQPYASKIFSYLPEPLSDPPFRANSVAPVEIDSLNPHESIPVVTPAATLAEPSAKEPSQTELMALEPACQPETIELEAELETVELETVELELTEPEIAASEIAALETVKLEKIEPRNVAAESILPIIAPVIDPPSPNHLDTSESAADHISTDATVEENLNTALEHLENSQEDSIQTEALDDSLKTSLADNNGVEQFEAEPVAIIEQPDSRNWQYQIAESPIEFENVDLSTEEMAAETVKEISYSDSVEVEMPRFSTPEFSQQVDHNAKNSQSERSFNRLLSRLLSSLPQPKVPQPKVPQPKVPQPKPDQADDADGSRADSAENHPLPAPASRRTFRWSASSLGLASAVGGFVLVNGVYLLTRPCAIGGCEPLQQATQLSQSAIQTAQTTESALAVVEAYKQLNEASYLLATIPSWSRHYGAAQTLLNSYEDQAVVLGKVVKALEQANTAAQKSQNPPHPLPEWREIQWLWREVIAQLEQIPPNSTLYPLVQRKLQEYRSNLAGIDQRVGIEQQAQDRINAARQAGQLAETSARAAQTAENWQETVATWTAAIAQLRQIPASTMVYDEAQQLLEIYQPNLTEATTRQARELTAAKSYAQALKAAAQARTSEQQNQWSQAATRWQSALKSAQQVPSTSSYYSQIQPLIGTYTQMLQQATQNFQRATAIQTIQPNLNRACPTAAKICAYTLSPQAIRVQFTASYAQTVALTLHNQQPTDSSRSSLLDQVNGSLRILAEVSKTTQVPIELYDAKGTKLGTYTPSLSGYVPQ